MAKWLRYVVLIVAVGASATVLSTTSAGQAFAQGAIKPIQALIVNNAANPVPVVNTDLYPAPFQGNLNFDANPSVKTCVSVPAGKGLILELVSVRTFSDDATAQFDLVIVTIAGGVEAHHDITLERLPLFGYSGLPIKDAAPPRLCGSRQRDPLFPRRRFLRWTLSKRTSQLLGAAGERSVTPMEPA